MCRVALQAPTKYVLLGVYHYKLIYHYIKYPTITIVAKSSKDFSINELKS